MTEVTIKDGGGANPDARTTKDGKLETQAVSITEFEHESEESGNSYSWCSDSINIDANDTVLLLKNTGSESLHMDRVVISASTDSEFTVHLPTVEVSPTGTTVSAVKLNTGKVGAPEVDARSDETNNAQGDVIESFFTLASKRLTIDLTGIILAKNKSIAIDQVADTALASATFYGHLS